MCSGQYMPRPIKRYIIHALEVVMNLVPIRRVKSGKHTPFVDHSPQSAPEQHRILLWNTFINILIDLFYWTIQHWYDPKIALTVSYYKVQPTHIPNEHYPYSWEHNYHYHNDDKQGNPIRLKKFILKWLRKALWTNAFFMQAPLSFKTPHGPCIINSSTRP